MRKELKIILCVERKSIQKSQRKIWRKKGIPISIQNNDVEINNPLGPHKLKTKINAAYLKFFEIPPEYDNQIENIFVAQLHKNIDYKKVGNHKIFLDLIEELRKIGDKGIEIDQNGKK